MKEGYDPHACQDRFRDLREYFQKAVDEGRLNRGNSFTEIFVGKNTSLYESCANPVMLMDVAKAMNELWVGDPRQNDPAFY